MSAVEVIAMIQKLPPGERQVVAEFMEQLKHGHAAVTGVDDVSAFVDKPQGNDEVRRADMERTMAAAEGIFKRHPDLFRRLAQ